MFATLAIAAPDLSGTVTETMNSYGYTFVQIEKAGVKTWVAVPETQVVKGEAITFEDGVPVEDFMSEKEDFGFSSGKLEDRTFKIIYFSPGIIQSSSLGANIKSSQLKTKKSAKVTNPPQPTTPNEECIEGDCQNGQGTLIIQKQEISSYMGTVSTSNIQEKYDGNFKNGKLYGQGSLTIITTITTNDNSYNGEFHSEYTGEFENGLLNGQGIMRRPDGLKYEGGFKDGKYHGQGKMITSQWTYEGEYKDGKEHGRGTRTASYGKYIGGFQDGFPHGQGAMTYSNGDKYVGEWIGGERRGQATMAFANGEKIVGKFHFNIPYEGTWTYPSGMKYVGELSGERYQGQGTLTYPTGEIYVGKFQNSIIDGQGTMTWPNGQKYIGEWRVGKFDGKGTLTYPSGAIYEGEFAGGAKHGEGTMTMTDGRKIVGVWSRGEQLKGSKLEAWKQLKASGKL